MHIPHEIAVEILSRLPVKSILRFRCVCKGWCKFLRHNSDFVKRHLNRSIKGNNFSLVVTKYQARGVFSMDSVASHEVAVQRLDSPFRDEDVDIEIFGSCNGLLFIEINERIKGYHSKKNKNLVTGLWNPATREYKIIPKIHHRVDKYGFGYDQESNDYKLVTIANRNSRVSQVHVYTLSTNSWRRFNDMPYKVMMGGPPGVFVNGALHWLAKPSKNKLAQVLLSFNVAAQVFIEIEYFDDGNRFIHKQVDVLEGLLAMLCSHYDVGFQVWVMNDYGVKESWAIRYTIPRLYLVDILPSFRYLRRIHSLKSGEMLLLEIQSDSNECQHGSLVLYDPRSDDERAKVAKFDLKKLWDETTGHIKSRFHTEAYVESLVSLHTGTYVGGSQEALDFSEAFPYCGYSYYYDRY